MKIAFLGDIHGNLQALEAVWARLEAESPDRIYVVGDLVGYGADGKACLEWIRDKADGVCLGNHDAVVCGKMIPFGFRRESLAPLERCRRDLPTDDVAWLASLPYVEVFPDEGWTLVHGSLTAPKMFPYVTGPGDARACFAKLRTPFCCLGHTHVPGVFYEPFPGSLPLWSDLPEGLAALPEKGRLLLNPGSVGQPRDGDRRAAWALFDSQARTVEVIRVDYDVQEAAGRILEAGLAPFLAERLFLGI